jgi:hypothetical protein
MKRTIGLWLAMAGLLSAGSLTFNETLQELRPDPDEAKVSADFKFTNKSDEPVVINRFDGGCSCVSVQISEGKRVYAPGESGVIRANFDMGTFSGTVDKVVSLWLEGDAEDAPSQKVTLRVHIPVIVEVEPKTVKWDIGQKPEAQTVKISMKGDTPTRILKVNTNSEVFSHQLKTIEEGRQYELILTPGSTEKAILGSFRLETDSAVKRQAIQQVFAMVKRPIPATPKK